MVNVILRVLVYLDLTRKQRKHSEDSWSPNPVKNLGAPDYQAGLLATPLRPTMCLEEAEDSVLHVQNKSSVLDISVGTG
jgi:hypothetical protein